MRKTLIIGFIGMVLGVVGWGGFNTLMEATNQMAFCISCHEMRDNVYVEYQNSPHYQNPSGVRATCPDCHVPRDWTHKLVRKIQATGELYYWATGAIDTPEKFEAKRHTLAKREWSRMRANDSRECRNCHAFDAMAFHKQNIKAARAMRDAAKAGKTCIDCHKAIAHKMPDVTAEHRRMFNALKPEPVSVGDAVTAIEPQPLSTSISGEPLGTLAAGFPVEILSLENDVARIELSGWQREGPDNKLYVRQGARIGKATITPTEALEMRTVRSVEDAKTGQMWSEVRLKAWVKTDGFMHDPRPLWDAVERMYEDNCSLCHALRAPSEYSANNWIGHVKSMTRMTPLTRQEAALLLVWLQTNAKE